MGILLSALAAAGDEGVRSINSNIAQQNAMDLEKQRQDLAEQKAKSVADYTNSLAIKTADAQREAGVARGQAALTGIVNQQMGNNWAASDKAAADLSLTDDQKTAIEQTKKGERFKLENDPLNMLIADAKTGDLKNSDLAKLLIDQNRLQAAAISEARKAAYEQAKLELDARKIDALINRQDKPTAALLLAGVKSEDELQGKYQKEISSLRNSLKDPATFLDEKVRQEYKDQIAELQEKIKESVANKKGYLLNAGIKPPKIEEDEVTKKVPSASAVVPTLTKGPATSQENQMKQREGQLLTKGGVTYKVINGIPVPQTPPNDPYQGINIGY